MKVILITGHLAALKSTIAKRLSEDITYIGISEHEDIFVFDKPID